MRRIGLFGLVVLLFSGCASKSNEERVKHTVVSDITRVFMHQPSDYTFFVRTSGDKIGRLRVVTGETDLTILEDAQKDQPIRIEYDNCNFDKNGCLAIPEGFSYWSISVDHLTIHLHSSSEVGGAGWEKIVGKKTIRGNTTVVE